MAQNNYKIQQETAVSAKKSKWKSSTLDPRSQMAIGWLLQGIALFLTLAFCAHLIHGKEDQHIIESFHLSTITKTGITVANWVGFIGAFLSYYCIYRWLGITAFLLLPGLFLLGIQLVRKQRWPSCSPLKIIIISIFFLLWSNGLLGYLYHLYPNKPLFTDQLGGMAYTLGLHLKSLLGYGTFVVLFTSFIIFSVVYLNITTIPLPHFGQLFRNKSQKFLYKGANGWGQREEKTTTTDVDTAFDNESDKKKIIN